MLSARLRELEKEGLVENRVDSSLFPVKSEYTLTYKEASVSASILSKCILIKSI